VAAARAIKPVERAVRAVHRRLGEDREQGDVMSALMPSKYKAFISYSHADTRWGEWLHRALEAYKIPPAYVELQSEADRRGGGRLGRMFRDRDELKSGHDLDEAIRTALLASEHLIVVCSPNAAQSRHVDQEVLEFKRLKGGRRLHALIVAGEPYASATSAGAVQECLPAALRFDVDEEGRLTDRPAPALLAADVRPGKDNKTRALSRIVAGLLGVDFDALYQRERRRRRLRLAAFAATGTAAALVLGLLGWTAWQRSIEANRQKILTAASSSKGMPLRLALLLTELDGEGNSDALALARTAANAALPIAVFAGRGSISAAALSPDGTKVVLGFSDGAIELRSADGTGDPMSLASHDDLVTGASFSPDGRRIVTTSYDRTARVHSADGTGDSPVLSGHDAFIYSASFSPDGARIVTASADDTARVWSTDGTAMSVVLSGHKGDVLTAAFSPDGTRIVTASSDETARVWHIDRTRADIVLKGHGGPINSAVFSPDGTRIVTASSDDTARVWPAAGSSDSVPLKHEGEVVSAAFSFDGARIVTASADHTARVWPTEGGASPVVFRHPDRVRSAAFSPDGARIVTAAADYTARIWTVRRPDDATILSGHAGALTRSAFSADGSRIVTLSASAKERLDRIGTDLTILPDLQQNPKFAMAYGPGGTKNIEGDGDGTVRVWPATGTGDPILVPTNSALTDVAYSPDGATIATASADGTVRLWTADGTSRSVVLEHPARVNSVAYDAKGTRIVTASDKTVRIWPADDSREPVVLEQPAFVNSAAFDPAGARIVAASGDGNAYVLIPVTAMAAWSRAVLGPHTGPVKSAVYSADGTRIATAAGAEARVWESEEFGKPLIVLKSRHKDFVNSAAFDAENARVVTASDDGTALAWRLDRPEDPPIRFQQPATPGLHPDRVTDAAFAPDGARIATVSADGTAHVWASDGRGTSMMLDGRGRGLTSVAFSPDGTRIVAASTDGSARIWRVTWEALVKYLRDATTVCLTAREREALGEEPNDARRRYEACERSHGRTPLPTDPLATR
jgi:WD40 repeat protein